MTKRYYCCSSVSESPLPQVTLINTTVPSLPSRALELALSLSLHHQNVPEETRRVQCVQVSLVPVHKATNRDNMGTTAGTTAPNTTTELVIKLYVTTLLRLEL